MNRRTRVPLAAVLVLTLAFLGADGCQEKKDSLALLTQTLGNAVASLIQVSGNAQLAETLKRHTDSAVGILKAWKPGMSPADAILSINQIIDDIKLFPAIDRYKPLITLALGTAASIVELLRAQGGGEPPHTEVRITLPPRTAHEFSHDWDAIRAGSPGMEQVPIL